MKLSTLVEQDEHYTSLVELFIELEDNPIQQMFDPDDPAFANLSASLTPQTQLGDLVEHNKTFNEFILIFFPKKSFIEEKYQLKTNLIKVTVRTGEPVRSRYLSMDTLRYKIAEGITRVFNLHVEVRAWPR
jgi:hypothetical protein